MSTLIEGLMLKIYVAEADKKDHLPLYEWVIRKAKDSGIAGATAFRAISGYGSHHQIHSAKILDLSINLPVLIEMVDSKEKIEQFLNDLESVKEGLMTIQTVNLRIYQKPPA